MDYGQRIYNTVISDGMPPVLGTLMVAQAMHETAEGGIPFSSNVFVSCNNAYGYKWAHQNTAGGACSMSPELDYYAYYDSVEDSAHELALWVKRRQLQGVFPSDLSTIQTPLQYATLLKSAGYYGDSISNYSGGLQYWYGQLSQMGFSGSGNWLLLALVAGLIWADRGRLFHTKKGTKFALI